MDQEKSQVLRHLVEGGQPGRAMGLDAAQTAALLQAGHTLYAQGRLADARNVFAGLAVLDPGNAYVHGMLGSICQREGNAADAVAHFDRCLELAPDDPQAWVNRGEVLLRAGQLEKAAGDFAEALRRDTSGRNPAANRARVLGLLVRETLQACADKGLAGVEEARQQVLAQLDTLRDDAGR
jgi:Flp pilus assembly protein TadD